MSPASALARRRLGRTDVEVTVLGCGGAGLGNLYAKVDDETADATLAAAWDAGIRYFDTAPHYGLGLSERRLGRALRDRPRDEYVVSTKVGRILEPNPAPTGTDLAHLFDVPDDLTRRLDYSADGVRRSLEESLERLGTDRIDVALVHDPDEHLDQTITEAIPALVALREQGVVGAVGVGMNQWPALLRIVEETDVDVVMVAGRWTLLDRSAAPLLDACAARGVSVLAAAPYNSGLLARPEPDEDAPFDYEQADPGLLAAARRLAARAQDHGATLPQAAVQFPARHPAVAAVVTGMAAPEHVRVAAEGMSAPIDEDFWSGLDQPRGET